MNISNELEATIQILVLQSRKIEAIKMVKEATGCDLKEAKDFVDTFPDDPQMMPVSDLQPAYQEKEAENIDEQLLFLLGQGKKLEAIKLYKDTTGHDLAQTKAYVDGLEEAAQAYAKNPSAGVPTASNAAINKRETQIDDVLQQQSAKPKSGCFIATACYEDYNAPEVWVLRQYRDEKLLCTPYGRAFVQIYYSVSPYLARRLKQWPKAKKLVTQHLLEPIIKLILK